MVATDLDDGGLQTISAELVDLEITNFNNEGGDWIVTVSMGNGETLLMNFSEDNCATSTTGIEYCAGFEQVSENVIVVVFEGSLEDEFGETFALVGAFAGLETDPDLLDFKGLATYYGGYEILIGSVELDDFWELGGEIMINADFAGTSIDGEFSGGGWDVSFEGEIAGNGWTATDTDSEIFGGELEIAEGGIQLDGVFYGETGEETAGTIIIDIVVSDGAEEDPDLFDITGIGGFIACEDPESCFDD